MGWTYKGYRGLVTLDEDNGILFGTVAGIRDVITFEGATVPELVAAFRASVDDYLTYCAERGREPETGPSVEVKLQLEPSVLGTLLERAEQRGESLDALVSETLAAAIG